MDDCADGDVRLMGGANSTLGRLEVCINRAWGAVCDRRFGTNEARVVCQQLQFSSGMICSNMQRQDPVLCCHYVGGVAIRGVFGTPPNPIFLENLACTGTEPSILDCPSSDLGLHECDHSQDAGVQCFGKHARLEHISRPRSILCVFAFVH